MITYVTKNDGSTEPFSPEKLNKLAQYTAADESMWSDISLNTLQLMPDGVDTATILQLMIKYCIEQESIEYSRAAARIEEMIILKSAERIGVDGLSDLEETIDHLCELGLWDPAVIPVYNPYWETLMAELYSIPLEYWTVKQWSDKYGIKYAGECIETVQLGALGLGLAHFGDTENAYKLAKAILQGKVNLPTPALNGGRNGDFDSVSCCIITGDDSIDSIGVADHIAYKMTAKKAGIGIEFKTRSKGAPVKRGRVTHLGKHGIYATVDKAVKMFTQQTRGGSATVSYSALDPQIMEMLLWKTQKVDIEQRLDKLDYSFVYNDSFMHAVVKNLDWYLFDYQDAPEVYELFYNDPDLSFGCAVDHAITSGVKHTKVKARDILKRFLTARQETGRVYAFNVTRANSHTPFYDTIYLSNLCQEICLPTKPYVDMVDLYMGKQTSRVTPGGTTYTGRSQGETAFCSLAAINVGKVSAEEYGDIAELVLRLVDSMIDKAPAMTPTMEESIRRRRSIGIGITGLAQYLYANDSDYTGDIESLTLTSELAERHYYHLLKASQKLAVETGEHVKEGINTMWLPIDTAIGSYTPRLNWEGLRGKPRKHSVLVAHMPTESSAVFSGASNGLYPPRSKVVYKKARLGNVQFIVDKDDFLTAWQVPNLDHFKYYSRVQDFSDQGISADTFIVPENHPKGKVPMSILMKEFVAQWKLGLKSLYYQNTKDTQAKTVQEKIAEANAELDDGCGGGCKI